MTAVDTRLETSAMNTNSAVSRWLNRAASPQAWMRVGNRLTQKWKSERLRRKVNGLYRHLGPVTRGTGPGAVIADGMWDNPNHFFRLRLFLEALPDIEEKRLVAILRHPDDPTRTSLEALGFDEFVTIESHADHRTETYLSQADALLADVRRHRDLLALPLPEGLPAYTYYDTVLKLARHPQPSLDNPLWRRTLAECLRNGAIYRDLLDRHPSTQVVLSHPWKNEYATLMWTALQRQVPAFHLTGYCEGIRIRRFRNPDDYATPVEYLTMDEFTALPIESQGRLFADGQRYLRQREAGNGTDINARHAFRPDLRAASRTEARARFGVTGQRPLAVIYSHVWFDFPHTFAMGNFTDFLDWMDLTLQHIRCIPDIDWVLKPHPTEEWYGGFRLRDLVGDLLPHMRLAPTDTDSLTAMTAADIIVTVHGTVGLEAAAHGLPVIAADHSFYSDWDFTHVASSRDHYVELLRNAANLPAPNAEQRRHAMALVALSLSPTPAASGVLEMRCDSSGSVLYDDILRRFEENAPALENERRQIRRWLSGSSSSYAANIKTELVKEGAL